MESAQGTSYQIAVINLLRSWELAVMERTPLDCEPFREICRRLLDLDTATDISKLLEQASDFLEQCIRNGTPLAQLVDDHLSAQAAAGEVPSEEGASARIKWKKATIYNNMERMMEGGLQENQSASKTGQVTQVKLSARIVPIISALEFWFINQLSRLIPRSVLDVMQLLLEHVFQKYTDRNHKNLEGSSRLDVLREDDDFEDLVDFLLEYESFGNMLKNKLCNIVDYREFCKVPMSQSMIKKFSKFSARYIIPKSDAKSRGYGFYVSGAQYAGDTDNDWEEADKENERIMKAYRECNMYSSETANLYEKVSPKKFWNIKTLNKEISSTLASVADKCSVLFFMLNCHGQYDTLISVLAEVVSFPPE